MIVNNYAHIALEALPADSHQTCITSPPYFGGVRDYHVDSIGLEQKPEEYLESLLDVFDGVKRVLTETGTLWVVIDDTRVNLCPRYNNANIIGTRKYYAQSRRDDSQSSWNLKQGELMGIPYRLCLALQMSGWHWISDIVYKKTRCMPEKAPRRPSHNHEKIFLFAKNKDYFYDSMAVRTPYAEKTLQRARTDPRYAEMMNLAKGGANLKDVWEIGPQPYKGHKATFPEAIPERCMQLTTRPGDLVLDPFCGSGTVLAVAERLGRGYTGIDLNPEYCKLAEERIEAGRRSRGNPQRPGVAEASGEDQRRQAV